MSIHYHISLSFILGVESNSERRHLSEDKFQVANEIKANHVDQANLLNKTV